MSPPIRDGSGNSINSIRLGDGSEISEVRTGAGDVVFGAIPDSVIHRYTFENNSNTTTLTDTVGSGDGSITGMTYTSSQADGDFAGDFDGVDDQVSNLPTEPPPISYTFDAFPRSEGPLFAWGFDFGNDQGITAKVINGDIEIVYGSTTRVLRASELSLNTRQHIGITISSSDDITVYIDGSQVGFTTSSNSGFSGVSSLGSEVGNNFGSVILDDFNVDNKVLTQSEVQARI
jgi:hypothetical protein